MVARSVPASPSLHLLDLRVGMFRIHRTEVLLVTGMLGGALLASTGIVTGGPSPRAALPVDVAALVNGEPVSRAAVETALGLIERERGEPVSPEERTRVVERLIDEELLLQRGLELGLARSDRKLRGELVAGVIDAATATIEDPSPAELRAFLDANRMAFSLPAALRVEQVFVATGPRSRGDAEIRAADATARLRGGEDIAAVRRELGDPPAVEIPATFLPAARLRDIVGARAAAVAQDLAVGEVGDPVEAVDGYRVLVVLEREAVGADHAEPAQQDILAEYRRRRSEAVLREYLADLRSQSEIRIAQAGE